MSEFNKEYASKAVAGTGLGLGIAATVVSLLNNNGGGNGGVLGNLLGNGNANQVSALQAEVAMLRGENYADKVGKEVYAQALSDNKELSDRVFDKYIAPMAQQIANNQTELARQEEQIKCLKETQKLREQILEQKIDAVACTANNGLIALQGTVSCLAQAVNGITKTIVPSSAICPAPMPQYNSWTAPTADTTTTG